jgi:hypothetical protein
MNGGNQSCCQGRVVQSYLALLISESWSLHNGHPKLVDKRLKIGGAAAVLDKFGYSRLQPIAIQQLNPLLFGQPSHDL